MLVSAVLDPSAFDSGFFNDIYSVHAEDFLMGIEKNGLLIVDSENRLRDALIKRIQSIPIKYGQRLQILIEELLLKKKSKRVVVCPISQYNTTSSNLSDLTYHLKKVSEADALIVRNQNTESNIPDKDFRGTIVPLSNYRESDFETDRRHYENKVGPIDTLPKIEVDNLIIHSVRFTKWLRFYDPQIGKGTNTSNFRKGIEYILSLWKDRGFFASQQGFGDVKIYTCSAERIRDDDIDYEKESKLERNQENYRKIIRELINPLKNQFPWPIELFVKNDPDGDFHARFLETQHAVINVERGFDLFKQNGGFKRNFISLFMAASDHIKECRELPEANISGVPK